VPRDRGGCGGRGYPIDVRTMLEPRSAVACSRRRQAVLGGAEQVRRGVRSGGPCLEERESTWANPGEGREGGQRKKRNGPSPK
jgi:hypothetical protein